MAIPVFETDWVASSSGSTAVDNLDFTKPAGAANGNLLIIAVGDDQDGNANFEWVTPTDWNFVVFAGDGTSDAYAGFFWKIADGTEGATLNITRGGVSDECYGWYGRVTGHDSTNPIHAFLATAGAASGTYTIDGVTTTVDDCLIIACMAEDGGDGGTFTINTGAGWAITNQQNAGTAGTDGAGLIAQRNQATAGAGVDLLIDSGATDGKAGFQIAIQPPQAANTSVPMDAGSFSLTGYAADVRRQLAVPLDAASFSLTGYDATATKATSGTKVTQVGTSNLAINTTAELNVYTAAATHTAEGGANNCLVVAVTSTMHGTTQADLTNSVVKYGATAMTLAAGYSGIGNNDSAIAFWYLMNPSTSAQTLEITIESTSQMRALAATILEFENVDDTTPIGATAVSGTDVRTIAIVATGDDNAMVVATSVRNDTNGPFTPTADTTELKDYNTGGSNAFGDHCGFVGKKEGTVDTTSYTVGGTPVTTTADDTVTAIELNVSAGLTVALDSASFVLTGHSTTLTRGLIVGLDSASFALAGYPTTVSHDFPVSLEVASFNITGYTTDISRQLAVSLDAASFSLTGFNTTVLRAIPVSLDTASFALTGYTADISTVINTAVSMNAGSFSLTVNDITVSRDVPITFDTGNFSITGYTALIEVNAPVALDVGSFNLVGGDLTTKRGLLAGLEAGSFELTGYTANVITTLNTDVSMAAGSFSLTGYDATIKRGLLASFGIGSFNLTGNSTDIKLGSIFSLDVGSFSFVGNTLTAIRDVPVGLEVGSFTLASFDVTVSHGLLSSLTTGSFSLTGFDTTVTKEINVALGLGSYTLTGYTADIGITTNTAIPMEVGSYNLSGLDSTASKGHLMSMGVGSYTFSGHDLADLLNVNVSMDLGVYTLTGLGNSTLKGSQIGMAAGSYGFAGLDFAITLDGPFYADWYAQEVKVGTWIPEGLETSSWSEEAAVIDGWTKETPT